MESTDKRPVAPAAANMRLVIYDGHEWREQLPLRERGYVCCECGALVKTASEMPKGGCRKRLAPIDWLALAEQTDDRVVVEAEQTDDRVVVDLSFYSRNLDRTRLAD